VKKKQPKNAIIAKEQRTKNDERGKKVYFWSALFKRVNYEPGNCISSQTYKRGDADELAAPCLYPVKNHG